MKKNRLAAKVTRQDVAGACQDEYGVLYSKDGKRLLKCNDKVLAVGGLFVRRAATRMPLCRK